MKKYPTPEGAITPETFDRSGLVYAVLGDFPTRVHKLQIASGIMQYRKHLRWAGQRPGHMIFEASGVIEEARRFNLATPFNTDNYLFKNLADAEAYLAFIIQAGKDKHHADIIKGIPKRHFKD